MQISLRSHLIAGTAAVVGAGAIAINPVMGAQLSLPSINVPAAAQVALAAFDSPLAQLFATLDVANNYLLDSASNPAVADNWPYAGFGTTFGTPPANYPLLPAALGQAALGGYSSVGVVSQFIDDALPIISQLGYNGLNYLNITGNALFGAGAGLAQSAWTAVGQLLTGNIPGALSTITTAISAAGTALLAAGGYVLNSVIAKASAVVNTLVGSLPQLLTVTAAQAAVVVATTSAVITNTVTALGLGNLQGAWNAAVDGLLGPSGIPGALLNLSIGAGIQTGPIATPDAAGIAAVFVPSTRTVVQATVKAITADLQTAPAAPAAAAPSAAAARSSAATEAAPAAEAPAGDSSAAATGSAPAEKPAAHRAARKAAKAAG
jgi:hypothetical protein